MKKNISTLVGNLALFFSYIFLITLTISYLTNNIVFNKLTIMMSSLLEFNNFNYLEDYLKNKGTTASSFVIYTVFVYIAVCVAFLSVLINYFFMPEKERSVDQNFTLQGLFNLLHDFLYDDLILPLSISGRLNKNISGIGLHKNMFLGESLKKYKNDIWVGYVSSYVFVGFIFFPWLVIDSLNKPSTFFPYWLAIIGAAYVQIRFLVELLVLWFSLAMKNKRR